jgi:hypothetical protein
MQLGMLVASQPAAHVSVAEPPLAQLKKIPRDCYSQTQGRRCRSLLQLLRLLPPKASFVTDVLVCTLQECQGTLEQQYIETVRSSNTADMQARCWLPTKAHLTASTSGSAVLLMLQAAT